MRDEIVMVVQSLRLITPGVNSAAEKVGSRRTRSEAEIEVKYTMVPRRSGRMKLKMGVVA